MLHAPRRTPRSPFDVRDRRIARRPGVSFPAEASRSGLRWDYPILASLMRKSCSGFESPYSRRNDTGSPSFPVLVETGEG